MASNWKIEMFLRKQDVPDDIIRKTFQIIRATQRRGSDPVGKFQRVYDSENGGVAYCYWQLLQKEGLVR